MKSKEPMPAGCAETQTFPGTLISSQEIAVALTSRPSRDPLGQSVWTIVEVNAHPKAPKIHRIQIHWGRHR